MLKKIVEIVEAPFRFVRWMFMDTYGRVLAVMLLALLVSLVCFPVLDTDIGVWEVRDTLDAKYSQEGGLPDVDAAGKIDRSAIRKREVIGRVRVDSWLAWFTMPFHHIAERQQGDVIGKVEWDKDSKYKIKRRLIVRTSRGLTFGLDIMGGTELTYRIVAPPGSNEVTANAQEVAEVIRKRVDAYGLKEPRIQPMGEDRLLVQIPGFDASDVARVKSIIMRTGRLEFRILADEKNNAAILKEAAAASKDKPPPGWHWYTMKHEDAKTPGAARTEEVLVSDETKLTGELISRVTVGIGGRTGADIAVHLEFTDPEAFWRVTVENNQRRLGILLDDLRDKDDKLVKQGRLHSAPTINEPILGGAEITGRFSQTEAEDLKSVLQSGSLKAPLQPESEQFVGPYQGRQAIQDGEVGSVIGFAAVVLFMLVYYLKAGIVANIALFLNVLLLIAMMSLRGSTLTLPGVAGVVLTIGMAVDANVLIFERIREEMKKGTEKSLLKCMRDGHERALVTIIDTNLTTLITAIILYEFGTGPVKGFAITLCYGLIISVFTAVVVARIIFEAMSKAGRLEKLSMLHFFGTPNIPFVAVRKFFMYTSVTLAFISAVYYFAAPGSRLGIEFSSGTMIQVNLKSNVNSDTIRTVMKNSKFSDVEVQDVGGAGGMRRGVGGSSFTIRIPYAPTYRPVRTGTVDPVKFPALAGGPEVVVETDQDAPKDDVIRCLDALGSPKCVVEKEGGAGKFLYTIRNGDRSAFAGRELSSNVDTVFRGELVTAEVRRAFQESRGAATLVDEGIQNLPSEPGKLAVRISLQKPCAVQRFADVMKGIGAAASSAGPPNAAESGVYNVTGPDTVLPKVKEALKGAQLATLEPFPQTSTIYPAVALELEVKAVIAVLLSFLGIIAYMWFRYDFKSGLAGVLALVHDVFITVGALCLTGRQMSLTVIAALLTIIGYSINDTIVVFDRIRENRRTLRKQTLAETIDISINQTLSRTILTSLTTFLATLALYIWGGAAINDFAFAMLVGIVTGTYSSIFIASPILLMWGEQGSLRGPIGATVGRTVRPLEGFRA